MSQSRAQKILQDLIASRTLTPAGLAWLTLAVDPWHDTAVTGLEGMPDQGIGKSVSFQVVQEISISKNSSPTALPAGNWSVRIGNYPLLNNIRVSPSLYYGYVISQDNLSAPRSMSSVNVSYAQDGVDFTDFDAYTVGASQGIDLPVEYTQGTCKVLGIGIEVINTTSPLYRQGLVSYCRMVQPDAEPFTAGININNPANGSSRVTCTPMRTLPKNLREMALYPGFAQTEATEGYYAPVLLKFNKMTHWPIPKLAVVMDDDPIAGDLNVATPIACYTTRCTNGTFPGNTSMWAVPDRVPIYYDCDSNCVVFSGLSDQTTLTLRVRFIMERFPSDAEQQLLVIATPTAVYDPVALELYSRAVQRLPAGVPFTENPEGEWWMKMVEEIANAAAPFLGAIHPGLGIAAKGIGTVAGVAATRSKTSRKKKKAKKAASSSAPPVAKPIVPSGANRVPGSKGPKPKPPPKPRRT